MATMLDMLRFLFLQVVTAQNARHAVMKRMSVG